MSFNPFDFATAGGLVKETENKSALGEEFLAEFSPEIRAFFRDPIEIKVEGKTIAHHLQMVKGGQGRLGAEKLEILSGMFVKKLGEWYEAGKLPNNKWGVRRVSYTVTNGRATNGIGDFSFYLGATSSEVGIALKEAQPPAEGEERKPAGRLAGLVGGI